MNVYLLLIVVWGAVALCLHFSMPVWLTALVLIAACLASVVVAVFMMLGQM